MATACCPLPPQPLALPRNLPWPLPMALPGMEAYNLGVDPIEDNSDDISTLAKYTAPSEIDPSFAIGSLSVVGSPTWNDFYLSASSSSCSPI